VLQFTATIDQGYLFEPERLDFGTVQKGEQPTRTVIMRCTSDTPVAIERIRPLANSRYCTLDCKERPKEEWANRSRPEYLITVQLKPEAPVGALREAYHVLTNRLRNKSTRYLVSADIESFYRVAPSGTYSIGVLASGEEKPYPIRVMADKPVTVKNIRTSAPYVQARVEPTEDPNEVNIFVTLTEDAPQGYIRDQAITFTVESDGQTQEETLFLKGRVRNEAAPIIRGSASQRGPVPGSAPADLQPEEMSP